MHETENSTIVAYLKSFNFLKSVMHLWLMQQPQDGISIPASYFFSLCHLQPVTFILMFVIFWW